LPGGGSGDGGVGLGDPGVRRQHAVQAEDGQGRATAIPAAAMA
jgi:hypothetical protein